jgi:hypothetical protein
MSIGVEGHVFDERVISGMGGRNPLRLDGVTNHVMGKTAPFFTS